MLFEPGEVSRSRIDYRVLRDGGLWLYHSDEVLAGDVAWLRGEGYDVRAFDCSQWKTEADFHAEVAAILRFPEPYGHNLDAFDECIQVVDIPAGTGLVLLFRHVEFLADARPGLLRAVLEGVAQTSRIRFLTGGRLFALLQSDDPTFETEPARAVPVSWNPQEWLKSKRAR